jgi:hypothetical protein
MGALTDTYVGLPRAARWLIIFGVFVTAYFVIVEPVMDATVRMNERADRQEAKLAAYRTRLKAADAEVDDVALGMRRFGEVELPGLSERRPVQLNTAISEILKANGVYSHTTRSSAGTLRPGPISEMYGPNSRVGTRIRDIDFAATPEQVAGVLADLERSPLVAAVSVVDLAPADDRHSRTIQATITVEAWIEPDRGAGE